MPRPFYSPALPGLVAASVLDTKSAEIPLQSATQVGGTLTWSAGVTAGIVVFEVAPIPGYTGKWKARYTADFVADQAVADSTDDFSEPGPFSGHGRWRIAATIVGGTASTDTQVLVGL